MSEFDYSLFDNDDAIPERSILYHQEMIGLSTVGQETLLDYLHRLAFSHRIHVRDLLREIIRPATSISTSLTKPTFSAKYAKTINGYGKFATEMSNALMKLTKRTGLEYGTFIPWREMLDLKGAGLLSPMRRWCPSCLAEAEREHRLPTHLLIWVPSIATHCGIHLNALQSRCPSCDAHQLFVSDNMAFGRCSHCGATLGCINGLFEEHPIDEKQRFILDGIAEMLSMGNAIQDIANTAAFSRQLYAVVNARCGGSIAELERQIGFKKSSMSKWFLMQSRIQFDQFFEVVFRLNISPKNLLSGAWQTQPQKEFRRLDAQKVRAKITLSAKQRDAIAADANTILEDRSRYVDSIAFANDHKMTIAYFQYWFPDLYSRLTRHRKMVRAHLLERHKIQICEKARFVVRELFASNPRISRHRIGKALTENGLCMKDPIIRNAALDERTILEKSIAMKLAGK